ncbi:MAG: mechanosensitive ion channel [candidate division Zixibacteria bacterium]|nr:mechanosensitive ion channel [candidate division Zixibacteria bacterium]
MEIIKSFLKNLLPAIPTVIAIVGTFIFIFVVRLVLDKHFTGTPGHKFRRQMTTLILSFAGLLVIIMVLPINDSLRGQLLSLIGILLTAAIALSATTFLGNIMAGFMLRAVRSFRPGDFIRVGEYFGRVSEQGLFHVEIQTEDRNLTTMPNLYLVTNSVKVIRSSGTIISAEVSLGYDNSRLRIEKLLLEAARAAQLTEPFVLVMELGDFAVTYRVSGLLEEVKQIISARSRLREMMLDKLHENGVEIVSPTFMNTRPLADDRVFIPRESRLEKRDKVTVKPVPEKLVFDKAEEAESLEKLRERYDTLGKEMEIVKEQIKSEGDIVKQEELKVQVKKLEARRQRLLELIKEREGQEE